LIWIIEGRLLFSSETVAYGKQGEGKTEQIWFLQSLSYLCLVRFLGGRNYGMDHLSEQ